MTEELSRKRPRGGRARKRAIRAHAAHSGVAYSVAARQVAAAGLCPGEILGIYGRTVYPAGLGRDRWSLADRSARPADERLRDARLAAVLPIGRAHHVTARFPPAGRPEHPTTSPPPPAHAEHPPTRPAPGRGARRARSAPRS